MLKRTNLTVAAVALVAAVAAWAMTSGPAVNATPPMLHLDAFNDHGGRYDITQRAGTHPAVVLFVTRDDQATQTLMRAFDKDYQAGRAKHLDAALVIVGQGKTAGALRTYVMHNKLTVPAGILPATDKDLKAWNLNREASTTLVRFANHKIQRSVANATVNDLKPAA